MRGLECHATHSSAGCIAACETSAGILREGHGNAGSYSGSRLALEQDSSFLQRVRDLSHDRGTS